MKRFILAPMAACAFISLAQAQLGTTPNAGPVGGASAPAAPSAGTTPINAPTMSLTDLMKKTMPKDAAKDPSAEPTPLTKSPIRGLETTTK